MPTELTGDQRLTLQVLGFLFMRMGQPQKARRVFTVLADSQAGHHDLRSIAALGAVELELGEAEKAVALVRKALSEQSLSSQDSALYLLLARALWAAGRKDEARTAVEEFRYLSAGTTSL